MARSTRRASSSVTGTSATKLNAQQKAAVEQYRTYLEDQSAQLVTATKAFTDAVDSGDVEVAKQLYPAARIPYERIEPVAETFGDLDPRSTPARVTCRRRNGAGST